MEIKESVRLAPGIYTLPKGLRITANEVRIEGEGVTLIGAERKGTGITTQGSKGVVISGITIRDYYHGIQAKDCEHLHIVGCSITSTAEVTANTIFLDIWLDSNHAYGAGICLVNCTNAFIRNNDLQHQMNGLLTFDCNHLEVQNNNCSYNSGFGIHLYRTCESTFSDNYCDYCCRFEPREGGLHFGHMGADAAGFLAVMGSSRNRFLRNTARLGGDGFFLAGLSPDGTPCGCDDNLFEENDASLSPNIAFEATFCKGNIFRNNFADRCNYGFWCGYSMDFLIEGNRMLFNRQAGIAVENGVAFHVHRNQFQANGHGILLWSRHNDQFLQSHPDRNTSRDWHISENTLHKNGVGIRIAADQDHGIRHAEGTKSIRPHRHKIERNDIQDNRIGIHLFGTDANYICGNTLNANVEANIRIEDSSENTIENNIGSRGAYL